MSRFPILRRWWLGVLAIVVLALPLVTVAYLNHRMYSLVAEINATGAGATVVTPTPWLTSSLARLGVDYSQLGFLLNIPEISWHDGVRSGDVPVTRQEMQRVVLAANRLGTVKNVCMWTPKGRLIPESLVPLRKLESLVSLDLQCGLHDDALEAVAEIQQLRELELQQVYDDDVSARGFDALATMPNLERLRNSGSSLTTEDLEAISRLDNLRTLVIEDCRCDTDGLRHLKNLPHLERLSLFDAIDAEQLQDGSFDRDIVRVLNEMPSLRELFIAVDDGLPPQHIARLKAALSTVTVIVVDTTPAGRIKLPRWHW